MHHIARRALHLGPALACGVTLVSSLLLTLAHASPLRADHPLIGSWRVQLPDMDCAEIYRIHADGTMHVTSAEEVSDSQFEISDRPGADGFYTWVDRIVRDNGKPDCSGNITPIGHTSSNFILLHPSGEAFLLCEKEDVDTCIGPFERVATDEI